MRTYYLFNINKEISSLTKNNPYLLYKQMEMIHKTKDIKFATGLYEQLIDKIDKDKINKTILNCYKDNNYYYYVNNIHHYYNKYSDVNITIDVRNSYLICKSNSLKLSILNKLKDFNLFACDFENADYFWLDMVYL